MTLKALRTVALSLVTLSACAVAMAAEPVLLATATTVASSQLQRGGMQAPMVSNHYPALAEAEMIGMGYFDFDTVLAQALAIPTAAGFTGMPSRAAIEEVLARTVSGMMP
ncbi:MAG: hypothetical protein H7Y33_10785 [Cytophagales bacterium]|nr:hypothetical protein [Rhizobacter sp.]